jgi:hypothetical protein
MFGVIAAPKENTISLLQFNEANGNFNSLVDTTDPLRVWGRNDNVAQAGGSTGGNPSSIFTVAGRKCMYGNDFMSRFVPYLLSSSNGTQYLTQNYNPEFNFGTNNFTLEGFFYFLNVGLLCYIFGNYTPTITGATSFAITNNTTTNTIGIALNNGTTATQYNSGASAYSLNTWTHCALAREGNNLKLYTAGVLRLTIPCTGLSFNMTTNFNWGTISGAGTQNGLYGSMDDLRVSNYAVYTANFTPPTVLTS